MDKITTSTKSLADYFKEKLVARNGGVSSGTDAPSSTITTIASEGVDERPRTGIGASRMRLEIQVEDRIEEETQRVGLSKFSSLMSSSFLAATSSMTAYIPPKGEQTGGVTEEDVVFESETKKHAKDKKKDKKGSKVNKEENVEKAKKKKLGKDKGKGKETEEAGEPSLESEDDRPADREKKESAISLGTREDDAEKPSHKKEKRKHKSESNGSEAGKSKKEKKKRRTDS